MTAEEQAAPQLQPHLTIPAGALVILPLRNTVLDDALSLALEPEVSDDLPSSETLAASSVS